VSAPAKKSRHEDPQVFLLEIVGQADQRLGSGAAEILGAAAGAVLALFVPFGGGMLLRAVFGSAIGSLVGKKLGNKDATWFKRRLELALERFDEANRLHQEGRLATAARDLYVDDLVNRFFDKNDSLLE
jgi:hypothetical protein